jgi:hypothetical protein
MQEKIIRFNEAKETLLFLFHLFQANFFIIPTCNSLSSIINVKEFI